MKTKKYPCLWVSVLYFLCALLYVAKMLLAYGVAFGEKLDIDSIASIVYAFVFLTFGLLLFTKEYPLAIPVWHALNGMANFIHCAVELMGTAMIAVVFGILSSLGDETNNSVSLPPVFAFVHIAAFLAGMTACVVFIIIYKKKLLGFTPIFYIPAAVSVLWVASTVAVLCITGESRYAFDAVISLLYTVSLVLTGKILKNN
ncbi:MAG: hypothetical protein J6A85_02205 [Clostridia bacterium]|nr:hypothetical protein [Clostridia bacterium]